MEIMVAVRPSKFHFIGGLCPPGHSRSAISDPPAIVTNAFPRYNGSSPEIGEGVRMETFGIVGMAFGLIAFIQIQGVSKELAELKKALGKSGELQDDDEKRGA